MLMHHSYSNFLYRKLRIKLFICWWPTLFWRPSYPSWNACISGVKLMIFSELLVAGATVAAIKIPRFLLLVRRFIIPDFEGRKRIMEVWKCAKKVICVKCFSQVRRYWRQRHPRNHKNSINLLQMIESKDFFLKIVGHSTLLIANLLKHLPPG